MPLEDLMKWVLAVKKIFAFLYFRNDIAFEEIELWENTDRGLDRIGNLFLYEKFEIVSDYSKNELLGLDCVDNRSEQLSGCNMSLEDVLYNPEHYFYFEGMKFIVPEMLMEII